MKLMPLTQGQVTMVDDEDFDKFSHWKWYARWSPFTNSYYAIRNGRFNNKRKTILLHREIMGIIDSRIFTDHINGDTLNNQKFNLRISSNTKNQRNRQGAQRNSKSGNRGVSWHKRTKKFVAQICVDGKKIHLGYRDNLEDARKLYETGNKKYFGEFGGNF